MRTMYDLLNQDPLETRARREDRFTEGQILRVLDGAAQIVREQSLRFVGAVPVQVINDPGVRKTRLMTAVDISDAEIDELGTGGLFDTYGQDWEEQTVLRIKKNTKLSDLDAQTYQREGGVDPWRRLGVLSGEKVAEGLNKVIVRTVRGSAGITTVAGSQNFAGASWQVADNFYKSVVKARTALRPFVGDAGLQRLAVLANSADIGNAEMLWGTQATPQLDLNNPRPALLPGGVYTSTMVTPGEAWFYANTESVMQLEVVEDLTVIPLPRGDEESRQRVRTSVSFHIPKPKGIVKATNIA